MATRTVAKPITVTSGAGTGVVTLPSFSGYLLQVLSIIAPANAIYDWVLRDADGYALAGANGCQGDQTYYYSIPSLGPLSLTYLNANLDGTYSAKVGVDFKS